MKLKPKEKNMDDYNFKAASELVADFFDDEATKIIYEDELEAIQFALTLASQKQPEMRDKEVCFSESGDNALEVLGDIEDVCQNLTGVLKKCQTIRTALEKGHRAQQIVDLMEQGNDIAFVSEHHGEFIYRTQKSPATQQYRDAVRELEKVLMQLMAGYKMHDLHHAPVYNKACETLTNHAETIKRAGGED